MQREMIWKQQKHLEPQSMRLGTSQHTNTYHKHTKTHHKQKHATNSHLTHKNRIKHGRIVTQTCEESHDGVEAITHLQHFYFNSLLCFRANKRNENLLDQNPLIQLPPPSWLYNCAPSWLWWPRSSWLLLLLLLLLMLLLLLLESWSRPDFPVDIQHSCYGCFSSVITNSQSSLVTTVSPW